MSDDVLEKDMAQFQGKADAIFEAILKCVWRNFDDEAQRLAVGDYLLHKMVWHATDDNEAARKVTLFVRDGQWPTT